MDDEPPLQAAYSPVRHNLILFDEMKPAVMIRNTRLFQGPPTRVILGATRTNKYTYAAFVFRKRLVVGANCWAEELAKLQTKAAAPSNLLSSKAASLRGRPVFPLYCVFLRHGVQMMAQQTARRRLR